MDEGTISSKLLSAVVEEYESLKKADEGPITGDTLSVTTKAGITAILTAAAGGAGAIWGALEKTSPSVIVAGMALAAIALLAGALVVRSDHMARAAASVEMVRVIPPLITAAHLFTQTSSSAPTASAIATAQMVAVPSRLRAKLVENDALFEVIAMRITAGDPEYLVARLDETAAEWKTSGQVVYLTDPQIATKTPGHGENDSHHH
ncbi:MAG: hypothetical protein WB709_05840 [Solirubrobacteraceae bacterium]